MQIIVEAIPAAVILLVVVYGFTHNINIFQEFIVGAKKGINTTIQIVPTLIALIVATTMLSASGAMDAFVRISRPISELLGFPSQLIPLALFKPLSGSAANAQVIDIFSNYGPDSEIGLIASVMAASTETTFYAISVYLSGKKYKSLRYLVPVALIGDLVTAILSVVTVKLFL